MKSMIYALVFLALIGCAPQKSLTVYTNPPGATLYVKGGATRISPATVYYDIDPAYIDSQGCLHVSPFTAIWSSGARVDGGDANLRLCGAQHAFAITIERPDVPGLDQDLAMARLLIEREIQRLQGQAALAEGLGVLAEGIACQSSGGCSTGQRRSNPVEIRTNCRTDSFGNTYCTSHGR